MQKKVFTVLAGLMFATLLGMPAGAADDEDKPKYKTEKIMKVAFKGGLLKKVASGEATAEETESLHEMLVALSKNEPHKGEMESWKKLTAALVEAGKAAVEGKPEAGEMLKKASNCKACHSKHK
jgi:hypothetical protein